MTHEELLEWLRYYPKTGEWMWLKNGESPPYNRPSAGSLAGTLTRGRWVIRFRRRGYFASRLAWFYMTGEWPTYQVDHINRNKSDDRWVNLRDATRSENMLNTVTSGLRAAKGKPPRLRLQIIGRQI